VRPRSRLTPWHTEVNFCTGLRVDFKDAEIERICGVNYQDFLLSLQTLTTIKTYTSDLRNTIARLDASVAQTRRGVVEKERALLQSKRTAGNLGSAIDTLQACLRLLDVVARAGTMIQEGKYW
jgi:exocyst complex component 6